MPYCKKCHNTQLFGSSKVPPASSAANGPVSGLLGEFDPQGQIVSITRLGADKAITRSATKDPDQYFDVCLQCGSQDIDWERQGENG
jgi:hypothetical protein